MTLAPVVDVHTHLAPFDSEVERKRIPELFEPEELIKFLDDAGIDEALVSVPPPFYRSGQNSAETREWVRSLNEGLGNICLNYPRLKALAYLPLDQVSVAIAEVRRLQFDERFVGWSGSAGGDSIALDDSSFEELWVELANSSALLILHPGKSSDPRLDRHYLTNLLGNPIETSVAAAQLILGGVAASFPKIRFVLVHCGGGLPAVLGRLERGVTTARPGVNVERKVRDEATLLWSDTLAHDRGVVDLAVGVFGENHLLLGSDWPFAMGTRDPVAAISHLRHDQIERISRSNPSVLLGRDGNETGIIGAQLSERSSK